jgi:MoxR-like ATPase
LLQVAMGYPTPAEEAQVIRNLQREHPINQLNGVTSIDDLYTLQRQVWEVHVDASLVDYMVRLVNATRSSNDIALGASPRASLALFKAAQALAAIRGRDHVIPDDIKGLVVPALAHRLVAKPEAELRGRTSRIILNDLLNQTPLDVT